MVVSPVALWGHRLFDDMSYCLTQIVYEDYVNGTEYHEQEYEEYEEYEDRFGLVEREDAETWDGEACSKNN